MANQESEGGYVEIPQTVEEFEFGLADYFLVHKDAIDTERILIEHGLPSGGYDPVMIPPEVRKLLWDKATAELDGSFTFLPNRIVLGHTAESVSIPLNRMMRMKQYFSSRQTGEKLPLTTNLGAPLLHAGSLGPQTYEILNESQIPLRVAIADLVCFSDVYPINGNVLPRNRSQFSEQKRGEILLPGDSPEILAIRTAIISKGQQVRA